jgi:hypothetical protein
VASAPLQADPDGYDQPVVPDRALTKPERCYQLGLGAFTMRSELSGPVSHKGLVFFIQTL